MTPNSPVVIIFDYFLTFWLENWQ